MDSRTDDYRAKIKNVHEDNLFKNEDEIYQMDFKIHKFDNLIKKLDLELDNTKKWLEEKKSQGVSKPGDYKPKFLKECHYDFIFKWYTENLTVNT